MLERVYPTESQKATAATCTPNKEHPGKKGLLQSFNYTIKEASKFLEESPGEIQLIHKKLSSPLKNPSESQLFRTQALFHNALLKNTSLEQQQEDNLLSSTFNHQPEGYTQDD